MHDHRKLTVATWGSNNCSHNSLAHTREKYWCLFSEPQHAMFQREISTDCKRWTGEVACLERLLMSRCREHRQAAWRVAEPWNREVWQQRGWILNLCRLKEVSELMVGKKKIYQGHFSWALIREQVFCLVTWSCFLNRFNSVNASLVLIFFITDTERKLKCYIHIYFEKWMIRKWSQFHVLPHRARTGPVDFHVLLSTSFLQLETV